MHAPPTRDPLWEEIAAFLCRHVVIPRGHQLSPSSRLLQDLKLSHAEAGDLMRRFFSFFRVRSEGFHPARVLPRPRRRWPWARRLADGADTDISASVLLSAAREGRWPAPDRRCAGASPGPGGGYCCDSGYQVGAGSPAKIRRTPAAQRSESSRQ